MAGLSRRYTYRDLALRYRVIVCDGRTGCRRGWSAHLHTVGRVDQYGYVHWQAGMVTYKGLRRFLCLVHWALNETTYRTTPKWVRLYQTNTWAFTEARFTLGVRLRAEDSYDDRLTARWLSRYQHLRSVNPAAYYWMYYPLRKADRRKELADRRHAQEGTVFCDACGVTHNVTQGAATV